MDSGFSEDIAELCHPVNGLRDERARIASRQIVPRVSAPGKSRGGDTSAPRSPGNGKLDTDGVHVNIGLEAVVHHLVRLERRLEQWNDAQQLRLDQALGNRRASLRSVGERGCRETQRRRESLLRQRRARHTYTDGEVLQKIPGVCEQELKPKAWLQQASVAEHTEETETIQKTVLDEQRASQGRPVGVESSHLSNGSQQLRPSMAVTPPSVRQPVPWLVREQEARKSKHMPANSFIRIVSYPAFDYFFASMIMLNSIFIGAQTEYRIRTLSDQSDPFFFYIAEKLFAGIFTLELLMRLMAWKADFCRMKACTWNLFDSVLVILAVGELILEVSTHSAGDSSRGNAGKVIKMFRLIRIVRIMRVLRFLAELRIMVTLIIYSVRSLFWLMILLCIILYIFSIFFTQGVSDYLASGEADMTSTTVQDLREYFGSLPLSAFTLFASITGGLSWTATVHPLAQTGWVFTALFAAYIFFAVFSVLNIVTGVFVDGAIQRSAQERDLRLEKEKEHKEQYVTMLMDLLNDIDVEGTGVITRKELEDAFKSEQVRYYFSVLDIDVADSNYLFDMLDLDRSGEVDMEEFVSGCLRLKGNAKSIDVHTMMFEMQLMMLKWDAIMDAHIVPPLPDTLHFTPQASKSSQCMSCSGGQTNGRISTVQVEV